MAVLALSSGCLTNPDSAYGTYTLRSSITRGSVPFAYPDGGGAIGDSTEVLSGEFAVRNDGRWTRSVVVRNRREGAWRAPAVAADSGTWSLLGGAGVDVTLGLEAETHPGVPEEPVQISEGRRLVSLGYIFKR